MIHEPPHPLPQLETLSNPCRLHGKGVLATKPQFDTFKAFDIRSSDSYFFLV